MIQNTVITILVLIAALDVCLLFWRIIYRFARDNRDLCALVDELESDNQRLATYCLELQARCKRLERLTIPTRPEVGRIERGNWVWTIEINLN